MMTVLSNAELRQAAPSIFAVDAHHTVSDKYEFLPTIQVVDALRAEGWMPVQAFQSKTKVPGRRDFTKHTIRFSHETRGFRDTPDSEFQVLLTNSHLGSAAFQMAAGVYRMVCSNGMIIADSVLDTVRVRHMGAQATLDNCIEGVYRIVDNVDLVEDQVHAWRDTQLTLPMQQAFARAALKLRWEDDAPIRAEQMLSIRRAGDRGDDLWHTFNRVQESLIRGGNRGVASTGRRLTTRPVTSLDESNRLNKSLWALGAEMQSILAAA